MVETAGGAVVVDGEAEVVGLAGFQGDVSFAANQLPGEHHFPGVAIELAFGTEQSLSSFHDTLVRDIAVERLVLAATPLVEVVEHAVRQRAPLDVFRPVAGGARHGACVVVAGGPAAALAGQFDLVAGFQHVGDLDRVFLVHAGSAGGLGLLPGEAQVEVFAIVRRLHLGLDIGRLARDRAGFDLLPADDLLAHFDGFLRVAVDAALAFLQRARTAMLGTLGDPLEWRYAGVEQGDFGSRDGIPGGGGRGDDVACQQGERHAYGTGYPVPFHVGSSLLMLGRRGLLFVFFGHAIGFVVCNTLVAIDARHAVFARHFVLLVRPLFLRGGLHAFEAVAVAAFARVGCFHPLPLVARQLQTLGLEFLAGIDAADQLAPELLGRLGLADHLVRPVLRHVAIGTRRSNSGAVAVMDRLLVLGVNVVAHLMARDAEFFGVGGLHDGVETAPENHPADDAHRQDGAERIA
ncbi:hypothetical protein D3C78_977630 [compost metagenome]